MMKILCIATIILGFSTTAYAIHCNVCQGTSESGCDDPFQAKDRFDDNCDLHEDLSPDNKLSLETIRNATGCLKVKFEDDKHQKYTHRSCYWGNTLNATAYCQNWSSSMSPSKQLSCDICTSDLCNSSTITETSVAALLLIVVLAQIMSSTFWQ